MSEKLELYCVVVPLLVLCAEVDVLKVLTYMHLEIV